MACDPWLGAMLRTEGQMSARALVPGVEKLTPTWTRLGMS